MEKFDPSYGFIFEAALLPPLVFLLFFVLRNLIFNKPVSLGRTKKLLKWSWLINSAHFGAAAPDPDDDKKNRRAKKLYRRFLVKTIFWRNPWLCPEAPLPTSFEEGTRLLSQLMQVFACHSTVVWVSMVVLRWSLGTPPFSLSEVFWTTGLFWCAMSVLEYLSEEFSGKKKGSSDD